MARTYAGILGLLAFVTSVARGILLGGGTNSVLCSAWCSLLAFAVIGCAVGWIAERTIRDSVSGRIAAELADRPAAEAATAAGGGAA